MEFRKAKLEGHTYTYEETDIPVNEWITVPPYGVIHDVIIQDFNNKISLSWVDSYLTRNKDGTYKIGGICGGDWGNPLKCWMMIPFPFDNLTGWHVTYADNFVFPKKKENKYLK